MVQTRLCSLIWLQHNSAIVSKLFSCLTDEQLLVLSSLRKPKRLTILGDDSREYKFLVKGGEDIRLDQRVEQVSSNHQSTPQGVVCQNSFWNVHYFIHSIPLLLLSFIPSSICIFFFPCCFIFSHFLSFLLHTCTSSLPCFVVVCGNEWDVIRGLKLFSAWAETKDIQCNSHDSKVMVHTDYFWYANAIWWYMLLLLSWMSVYVLFT